MLLGKKTRKPPQNDAVYNNNVVRNRDLRRQYDMKVVRINFITLHSVILLAIIENFQKSEILLIEIHLSFCILPKIVWTEFCLCLANESESLWEWKKDVL
jgi:hypothetical protein